MGQGRVMAVGSITGGGGGAEPWGWCMLDPPWSPQRELLSVSTEGEGGPQGRPVGPEISTKPKLV